MARTSHAALLPPDASAPTPNRVLEDVVATPAADRPAGRAPQKAPEPPADPRTSEPEPGPRYLQMERKEARIRLDQADALAQLTRRLNRARSGGGERITYNTLIRVAVDVLLARSDRLVGTTEREPRESLTL